jgi:TPR repeat protein
MRARNNASLCVHFLVAAVVALPVKADPIPEPWQSKRETVITITDKACNGDEDAISEVHSRLAESDPVMMNATVWLRSNCDAFKSMTKEETAVLQRKSALAGFPIAMSNYGVSLLRGDLGVAKDHPTGLALMERSIEAGYGEAARVLAEFYAKGEWLPRDVEKARAYIAMAEAEGVSSDEIASVHRLVSKAAAAEPNESEQGSESTVQRAVGEPDKAPSDTIAGRCRPPQGDTSPFSGVEFNLLNVAAKCISAYPRDNDWQSQNRWEAYVLKRCNSIYRLRFTGSEAADYTEACVMAEQEFREESSDWEHKVIDRVTRPVCTSVLTEGPDGEKYYACSIHYSTERYNGPAKPLRDDAIVIQN